MKYDFYITSMVASRTGEPGVTVTVNGADFTVNLTVDEARALAQKLLNTASSAETDAFLVSFLRSDYEANDHSIGYVLGKFRDWKHAQEEMPPAESERG